MNKIDELKRIINESSNIVFFGGAGVSTESGIKDFRGKNGLYKQKLDKPTEYYLSSDCFFNDTENFFKFYHDNMNALKAEPNVTHRYLTKLEDSGKLKAIITQNIDGLHQKAKSKNVLEVHGTIHKNHCLLCNKEYDGDYVFRSKGIPKCDCGGIIKPDVVLYGEMLPDAYIEAEEYDDEEKEIKILRTKRFGMKPMYPEDACIQMELTGHDFFVFRNAETDEVNVVYKRKGNTYGIIEPEC